MPSSAGKKCARSEEHTSELQSHDNLVCRLLLDKKNQSQPKNHATHYIAQHAEHCAHARQSLLAGGAHWLRVLPRWTTRVVGFCVFFFFNDTATTEIYPLSLHDALPIYDTATTEIYTLSYRALDGRRI